MKTKNLSRITLIVMIVTLCGKALGFFREVLIGKYFGASYKADALFTALSIPTIIFSSIAFACGTAFIPVYSKIRQNKGDSEGNKFTNNLLNLVCCISLIITFICLIFSKEIVSIFSIGFDKRTFDLANELTKIIAPTILFVGIANIMTSYLQANERYFIPNIVLIPQNLVIIFAVLYSASLDVQGVVWAYVAGAILQVIMLLVAMKKSGYSYNLHFDMREENMSALYKLFGPILISTSVQQLSTMVDRSLASTLEKGSVAVFNYASTLNNFVFGIVSISIATIIYPILSNAVAKKDYTVFGKTLKTALEFVNILIMPLVTILLVLNFQIVEVIFERGAFQSNTTKLTASVLCYYCIGMLFFGYRDILNRVFFSLHDTKTPMYNGILTVILNIISSVILVKWYGLVGIALATSLSAIFTTLLLIYRLNQTEYKFPIRHFGVNFIKCFISCVVMAMVLYVSYECIAEFNYSNHFIIRCFNLVLSLFVGAISYIVMLWLLRINVMNAIKVKRTES
ncbi:murein biosynthesis integral membrane protein MurJ [Bacillus cereus group sp. TH152-1LC]|uniref:murein biosynthesis integral membrane protein MurJ n=1 Tax=Bacillus cereus group sp. TH152-1LC TaxID=3018060 RepID=UPI0022E0C540|nr:murein biosynthesis integral membrane protein MurJ [Bacillus cereus group sp. TH152-1LC]MDA1679381.1 murein biosynthesis integral membrane protein MurJ [Bacillus cereus group sp. TH152-1LC]